MSYQDIDDNTTFQDHTADGDDGVYSLNPGGGAGATTDGSMKTIGGIERPFTTPIEVGLTILVFMLMFAAFVNDNAGTISILPNNQTTITCDGPGGACYCVQFGYNAYWTTYIDSKHLQGVPSAQVNIDYDKACKAGSADHWEHQFNPCNAGGWGGAWLWNQCFAFFASFFALTIVVMRLDMAEGWRFKYCLVSGTNICSSEYQTWWVRFLMGATMICSTVAWICAYAGIYAEMLKYEVVWPLEHKAPLHNNEMTYNVHIGTDVNCVISASVFAGSLKVWDWTKRYVRGECCTGKETYTANV